MSGGHQKRGTQRHRNLTFPVLRVYAYLTAPLRCGCNDPSKAWWLLFASTINFVPDRVLKQTKETLILGTAYRSTATAGIPGARLIKAHCWIHTRAWCVVFPAQGIYTPALPPNILREIFSIYLKETSSFLRPHLQPGLGTPTSIPI